MVAGAIFAAVTFAAMLGLAYVSSDGGHNPCKAYWICAVAIAYGIALSAGFIGGAASAKGQLGEAAQGWSLAFAAGGGISVFIIVFFLLQLFSPDQCKVKGFVHGTLSYTNPEPRSNELEFKLAGPNNRAIYTSKDKQQIFFLADAEIDQIVITVNDRPLYKACTEPYIGKERTRDPGFYTIFVITLKDAYQGSKDSTIDLKYIPLIGDATTLQDQLTIKNLDNIDQSHIDIKRLQGDVIHAPEDCWVDASQTAGLKPFIIVESAQAKSGSVGELLPRLIPAAQAEAVSPGDASISVGDFQTFVATGDKSSIEGLRQQFAATPAQYIATIDKILDGGAGDKAIINTLDLLRDPAGKTYRLPDSSLEKVLTLGYAGSQPVSQAARNYLLSGDVVDVKLADLTAAYFAKHSKQFAVDNSAKYLQLAYIVRDIYYNAGYRDVVGYRGAFGAQKRGVTSLDDAKRVARLGVDLIAKVPDDKKFSFAKAYYGLTYMLYGEAVVTDAVGHTSKDASSQEIEDYIFAKIKTRTAPVPFLPQDKEEFVTDIGRFLQLVNGYETKYLWPNHIKQLKTCEKLDYGYGCFYYSE